MNCFWFTSFITDIIPPGNEDLKGDEADEIIKFKHALNLEDPDAASVHIEASFCFAIRAEDLLTTGLTN